MNINPVSVNTANHPTTFISAATTVKGYRVERRYEGDRTASQVVSALMKVHSFFSIAQYYHKSLEIAIFLSLTEKFSLAF